jgi:hypothetical protein
MGPDGVTPERPLADPLDDDTADRLLAGRIGPDDAPPGYAGVTGVLQAAAGPGGGAGAGGRDGGRGAVDGRWSPNRPRATLPHQGGRRRSGGFRRARVGAPGPARDPSGHGPGARGPGDDRAVGR